MAQSLEQQFHEAQRQLSDLNRNINILCSKIWKDLSSRSSKEIVALLKSRVEGEGHLTRIETLDRVFSEFIGFVDSRDTENANIIAKYASEIAALKRANKQLKRDLRQAQEESEELDRINESLGGTGLGSLPDEHKTDILRDDRVDQRVLALETELSEVRNHLTNCRLRESRLRANQRLSLTRTMPEAGAGTIDTDKMLKKIQGLVPMFSGEQSTNLHAEVYRFVDGVNLAMEGLTGTQKVACLKMIKQRLTGDAFNLVRQIDFTDEKVLIKLIRNTYLKTRSLDSINLEIWNASQRADEDIRQYQRRLQDLSNTATAIVKANYEGEEDTIMAQELAKKIRRAFISGLRDKVIGSSLIHSTSNGLTELADEALEAQATFRREEGAPQARVCFTEQLSEQLPGKDSDTVTGLVAAVQQLARIADNNDRKKQDLSNTEGNRYGPNPGFPPCSFCGRPGHTRSTCWERDNTPYCSQCGEYGHEKRASCSQQRGSFNGSGQVIRGDNRNEQSGTKDRGHQNPFRDNNQKDIGRRRDFSDNEQRYLQNNRNNRNNMTARGRNQSSARSENSQNYGGRSGNANIRCYSCGALGHISTTCNLRSGNPRSGNR